MAHGAPRSGPASTWTSTIPAQLAKAFEKVAEVRHVTKDEARALGFWHDDAPEDNPMVGRGRQGGSAALAPCPDQHRPPAAQAGPGDPGHAGPERHRRRARADRQPDSAGARGGVHPGRRHRRHQVRSGDLARAPDHRGRQHRFAPGGAQQDRHDVGLAEHAGAGAGADRPAARHLGRNPGPAARAGDPGVGAEGPGRQGHRRHGAAAGQPAAGARAGAGPGRDGPAPEDPALRGGRRHRRAARRSRPRASTSAGATWPSR